MIKRHTYKVCLFISCRPRQDNSAPAYLLYCLENRQPNPSPPPFRKGRCNFPLWERGIEGDFYRSRRRPFWLSRRGYPLSQWIALADRYLIAGLSEIPLKPLEAHLDGAAAVLGIGKSVITARKYLQMFWWVGRVIEGLGV